MPFATQLALSIELTRLLPFQPVADAVGASVLNLARDLQRSGSDVVVEEDLALIFGRARIEAHFESGFRTVVAKHSSTQLNSFLDIFLESGAGPTVRRSLRTGSFDIYFSTVVQLSLLMSAFSAEDLTRGLRQALAHRAEAISDKAPSIPAYDALSSTLRAIQDQTSAFCWSLLLDAVHMKLFPRCKTFGPRLPVTILQGCLDMLAIVQRFPDERFVHMHVTQKSLAEFLVVWSHHVMGLAVTVCDGNGAAYASFGRSPANVVIILEDNHYNDSQIVLLDRSDDELFRIHEAPDDPEIDPDERAHCGGLGTRYLSLSRTSTNLSQSIVHNAVKLCQSWFTVDSYLATSISWDVKDKVVNTANFLFPGFSVTPPEEGNDVPQHGSTHVTELRLAQLIFTLACVVSLDRLQYLPVRMHALNQMPARPPSSSRDPFENMKLLLVGKDKIRNAVLVSSHGWSVYTNVLGFPDPSNITLPLVHVVHGVPTRGGERKRYIVDAIVPRNGERTPCAVEDEKTETQTVLGNALKVRNPRWFVGTTSLSFEILITFELEDQWPANHLSGPRSVKMMKAGLLELESAVTQAKRTLPCQHEEWHPESSLNIPQCCQSFDSECNFRLGERDINRVFVALSAGSKGARWFCLLDAMRQARGLNSYRRSNTTVRQTYLRDERTCPDCAIGIAGGSVGLGKQDDSEAMDIAILVL